jgi:hypothetical protein
MMMVIICTVLFGARADSKDLRIRGQGQKHTPCNNSCQ